MRQEKGNHKFAKFAFLVFAPSVAIAQQTWYVDPVSGSDANPGTSEAQPFETIQAGVDAASDGDVVLLLPGVRTAIETMGGSFAQLGNENVSLQGKTITIRGRDGAANTIIDVYIPPLGVGEDDQFATVRAFLVTGGQGRDLVFESLTIANAQVGYGGDGDGSLKSLGGAFYIENASPTFRSCVFENNSALAVCNGEGGAVYAIGNPVFESCVFINNVAAGGCADSEGGKGAGVYVEGDAEFENCFFEGNRALSPFSGVGGGGAIWSEGALELIGCEFLTNQAYAPGSGGAVWWWSPDGTESLRIDRCALIENTARGSVFDISAYGGALVIDGPSAVSNSLFDSNNAFNTSPDCGDGGTTFPASADAIGYRFDPAGFVHQVVNCTFVGHDDPECETPFIATVSSHDVQIINSILWGNDTTLPFSGVDQVLSSIVQGGFGGGLDVDPMFLSASTGNYTLNAGSPAIDAGNNTLALGSADLAGYDRFFDDPDTPDTGIGTAPIVDLGAFEFQPGSCSSADLAAPFGVLDFSDAVTFLVAFSDMNASADFAKPFGVFDFADVVAFLSAFGAGCP